LDSTEALSRLDMTPLPLTSLVRELTLVEFAGITPPASRISVRDGFYGWEPFDFI